MRRAAMTMIMMAFGFFTMGSTGWGDEFADHMKKYHKHMNQAAEEWAEGDMEDYYEEMGKAQWNYNEAMKSAPPAYYCSSPQPPAYRAPYRPAPRRYVRHEVRERRYLWNHCD